MVASMAGEDGTRTARRALASIHDGVRRLADDVRPLPVGFGVRTASLPLVWTLNQLCVTVGLDPGGIVAWAERHQGDLPYRHVVVADATTAATVEGPLLAAGWRVEHEVIMALEASTIPEAARPAVAELDEAAMLGLMARWLVEDHPDITPAGLEQVLSFHRRAGRLWAEHRLGMVGSDGAALAVTKLRHDGPLSWVEDVYTLPEARRRGHGRRLVTEAVARASARPGPTFIVADDDGWPQHLYASVGFRPVARTATFHRELG